MWKRRGWTLTVSSRCMKSSVGEVVAQVAEGRFQGAKILLRKSVEEEVADVAAVLGCRAVEGFEARCRQLQRNLSLVVGGGFLREEAAISEAAN